MAGHMTTEGMDISSMDVPSSGDDVLVQGHHNVPPRLPEMSERGDNRQHLMNHLLDHDYASPVLPELPNPPPLNTNDPPPQPVFINTEFELQHQSQQLHQPYQMDPRHLHPAFNSPAPQLDPRYLHPAFDSPAPFLQPRSDFLPNRVVYGDGTALGQLLDYIEEIKQSTAQIIDWSDFKEGVLLSRVLQLQAPGTYNEQTSYTRIANLGSGAFGSVFKCMDRFTGMEFACKKVTLDSFRRQEVEVLVKLRDNTSGAICLPEIYGVIIEGNFVKILMEFVDLSWLDVVRSHRQLSTPLPEPLIVDLLKQSLLGLRHLQRHNISHCDIKPDNLGYNSSGKVKLLDFGTVRLPMEEFTHRGMTAHYMSPEASQRLSHKNSDTWSLACSALYLINQTHPWWHIAKGTKPEELIAVVQAIKGSPYDIYKYVEYANKDRNMSPELCDLLVRMLHPHPDKRINAETALKHSIFAVTNLEGGTVNSIGAAGDQVPAVVQSQVSDTESNIEGGANQIPPYQGRVQGHGQNMVNIQGHRQNVQGHDQNMVNIQGHRQNVQGHDQNVVNFQVQNIQGHGQNMVNIQGHNVINIQGQSVINLQGQVPNVINVQGQGQFTNQQGTPAFPGQAESMVAQNTQTAAAHQQVLMGQAGPSGGQIVGLPMAGHHVPKEYSQLSPALNQATPLTNPQQQDVADGNGLYAHGQSDLLLQPDDSLVGRSSAAMDQQRFSSGATSSVELPLDLSQTGATSGDYRGNQPNVVYGTDYTDKIQVIDIDHQVADTSGYNSTFNDVSIEVTHGDKVDHFKAPQYLTIGDIWPTVRDKARRLTSGCRSAVAVYEDNRKVDTSVFNEVLSHDRRFSLVIMSE